MKKRILSLFLAMTLFFAVFSAGTALAQEGASRETLYQPTISEWAIDDLAVGDTYDIYPQRWYTAGINKPITQAQLRVLMAGIRNKLLKTECVTKVADVKYILRNNMTVKDVLEIFYTLINTFEFNKDIGIAEGGNALDYMAKTGIFTGKEGELSLKDTCTIEQACTIATRLVTYIYDALDAASKGFLWEIKSGGNTAYLLGSIHAASYDIYPFSNKMLKAFADSDVLCVEADILNPQADLANLYIQYGYYTDGTTLKDHIPEELYEKAVKAGAALGLTEDVVALMKPWLLYNTISTYTTTSSGNDDELLLATSLGIDMKFLLDAYLTGKPVVELESIEYQLEMFDSFSDELDEFLLDTTLETFFTMNRGNTTADNLMYKLMLQYWHDGDVESFKNAFAASLAPSVNISDYSGLSEYEKKVLTLTEEYVNKLFTERDKRMAAKIDEFLKADGCTTYFIVVGSGHYISNYSVLDILREMGYEINQIK